MHYLPFVDDSLKISTIIARFGLPDIYDNFFSKESAEVLNLIQKGSSNPLEQLKQTIKDNFSADEILRSKKIRNLVLLKLLPDEAKKLCMQLNIKISDDKKNYDALTKKSFIKNSNNEKKLFNFFEEKFIEYIEHDEKYENITEACPVLSLHDYQRHAVKKIMTYLSGDRRRCLLHMPTGSGKTMTAVHAISNWFLNKEPTLVVWLAYNEELCEQAMTEFIRTWRGMGNRTIPIIKFFGEHSEDLLEKTKSSKEGFIIASLGKMHEADKRQNVFLSTLSDRIDFVIMDEAHQAPASTYQNVLSQLVEKHVEKVGLLGLSATPGRTSDQQDFDTKSLARFFYHNKISLQIKGYDNPIDYLIDKGYTAKPNLTIKKIDSNLTDDDLKNIRSSIDIPKNILDKIGKNAKRTLLTINMIKSLITSGHKRIMVFGASVENSRDIAIILRVLRYKSFHVDGNTSPQRRKQYVDEYKQINDKIIIMCNFGVFTTGFDAPQTSAVLIARPTKSVILYSQMVGRAMRGPNMNGNKECEICTITDIKLTHFQNIVENFFSWEDIW